jgi:hypothetical protein
LPHIGGLRRDKVLDGRCLELGIAMEKAQSPAFSVLASAAVALAVLAAPRSALAGAMYNWSRLSGVEKIGYVNPYFAGPEPKEEPLGDSDRPYAEKLRRLRLTLQKAFVQRLRGQKRFVAVPQARVERELHRLHWTAADLFADRGMVRGKGRPRPDTARIAWLAQRIGVDALVVGVMYHPASIGEGPKLHHEIWSTNPLNLSVRRVRAHVISPRVQSFLVTTEGITVWRDEQMADHPRSGPRTPRTLLADWIEATAQVANQLADSLLRMPPPGR